MQMTGGLVDAITAGLTDIGRIEPVRDVSWFWWLERLRLAILALGLSMAMVCGFPQSSRGDSGDSGVLALNKTQDVPHDAADDVGGRAFILLGTLAALAAFVWTVEREFLSKR